MLPHDAAAVAVRSPAQRTAADSQRDAAVSASGAADAGTITLLFLSQFSFGVACGVTVTV